MTLAAGGVARLRPFGLERVPIAVFELLGQFSICSSPSPVHS